MIPSQRTYRLERTNRLGRKSRMGALTQRAPRNALVFLYLGCLTIAALIVLVIFRQAASSSSDAVTNSLSQSALLRTSATFDWPVVHIVNTRFMQDQGHLTTLATARLDLFRAFCLPTMMHQTCQRFLWIIKIDPHLNSDVRKAMVNELKDYPNFFLVGSNINYQVGSGAEGGTWRNGVEGSEVLKAPIYCGDVSLLERAHAARNSQIVLETRLDADDGLNTAFIKYVQETALETFSSNKSIQWLYWCSRRHLEWYPDRSMTTGRLNPVEHSKLCITPGITVGYGVGVRSEWVPDYAHDKLYKAVEANGGCGLSRNIDCINLVEKLPVVAVRSRTLTSAGMKDTVLDSAHKRGTEFNRNMWSILENSFHLSPDMAAVAQSFLQENLLQIAKDNLEGQCTSGHSCKLKSVEQLQRLIDVDTEGKSLLTVS